MRGDDRHDCLAPGPARVVRTAACSPPSPAGCDIVTADLQVGGDGRSGTRPTSCDPAGRVEIGNVNGKIEVEPSTGNTVDVDGREEGARRHAEAAKAALERATIVEDVSSGRVKIETKIARSEGIVQRRQRRRSNITCKVPAGAEVKFTTVNGGIEISGLKGASPPRRPTAASRRAT